MTGTRWRDEMSAPWKPPLRLDHLTGYLPDIVDAEDRIVVEAVDAEEGTTLVHRANAYEGLVEALERIAALDYKHAATNLAAYDAHHIARRTLDSLEESDDVD